MVSVRYSAMIKRRCESARCKNKECLHEKGKELGGHGRKVVRCLCCGRVTALGDDGVSKEILEDAKGDPLLSRAARSSLKN